MSDQSRRFVQRNAPEPDGDIAQDDPIEDVDDFLLQAVDEGGVDNGHASVVSVTPPSHQDAQASDDEFDDEGLLAEDFENSQRVNELTGSKGLVEPVQTSSTTSIGHQSSSQTPANALHTDETAWEPESSKPPGGDALQEITSSQAAAAKANRPRNTTKWSTEEDKMDTLRSQTGYECAGHPQEIQNRSIGERLPEPQSRIVGEVS